MHHTLYIKNRRNKNNTVVHADNGDGINHIQILIVDKFTVVVGFR